MKVTGFTFIRNAVKFDYPIVESVKSILSICDEFVVAVGNSEDDTRKLIEDINSPKIRIINTIWDTSYRMGGKVLAMEASKAYAAVDDDSDWAFYLQGDEVVHEKYLDSIYNAMFKYKDDLSVDGLLFNFMHFYGSYDYIGNSSQWYEHEIRVIRKRHGFYPYRDAQGFRKDNDKKLIVKLIDAFIYHYGWVKDPRTMKSKQLNAIKLYHEDNWIKKNIADGEEFDYSKIDVLIPFNDTHPEIMRKRIAAKNWKFDRDISHNRHSLKELVKHLIKRLGWNLYYQNYIISSDDKN